MFLRKLRWLAAGVLAFGAVLVAPGQSRADVSVLVQEVNSGGTVVASYGTFDPVTSMPSNLVTQNFTINSFNATLFSNGSVGSLSSNFILSIGGSSTPAFTPGDGLLFTVTATNVLNSFPGQPGAFTNNAGATSAIAGTGGSNNIAGINQVTSTTTVIDAFSNPTTTPPSVTQVGDSSSNTSSTGTTTGNVSNLPNPYTMIQTILVYAIPVSGTAVIQDGATFTGGASSTVTSNAGPVGVPAPGGLALALIALPLMGLRRTLRRKASEPTI